MAPPPREAPPLEGPINRAGGGALQHHLPQPLPATRSTRQTHPHLQSCLLANEAHRCAAQPLKQPRELRVAKCDDGRAGVPGVGTGDLGDHQPTGTGAFRGAGEQGPMTAKHDDERALARCATGPLNLPSDGNLDLSAGHAREFFPLHARAERAMG